MQKKIERLEKEIDTIITRLAYGDESGAERLKPLVILRQ